MNRLSLHANPFALWPACHGADTCALLSGLKRRGEYAVHLYS